MKKQMKLLVAVAAAATMTFGSAFASMAANVGWVEVQGYWYYYDEQGNVAVNRWVEYDGNSYWAGSYGRIAVQDWIECDGDWYFVNADGAMVKNQWIPSGHDWYYVGEDGKMLSNRWLQLGKKTYWLEADGKAAKGWRWIDGESYFFDKVDCTMAANGAREGYTVDENGAWVK